MLTKTRLAITTAALLSLTACGMHPRHDMTPVANDTHAATLHRDYRDLEASEAQQYDWKSAWIYHHKAWMAGQGMYVAPFRPDTFHLNGDGESYARLTHARRRLDDHLNADTIAAFPVETANAQAAYDCYVEQLSEDHQPHDIAACKARFEDALAIIDGRHVMHAQASDVLTSYQIYFDFDKSTLRPDSLKTLDRVAHEIEKYHPGSVTVGGHTDRAGTVDYNDKLSARRAKAVSEALTARGVPNQVLDDKAYGENDPAVPTKNGVRLEENRRVVIDFNR
jgi:OOP family OmpA-OmpF porin